MHLVRHSDGIPYLPSDHIGVEPRRLQGGEAGGPLGLKVSLSHYPVGSGSNELVASPGEMVYVVISGELDVEHAGGVERLGYGDSISFSPGEVRAARNPGPDTATLIVIHGEASAA